MRAISLGGKNLQHGCHLQIGGMIKCENAKVRNLARIKCERKCERNFRILYINTVLATTTE